MKLHQLWRLQHYVARGFTVGEISWEQIGAGASKSSQVIEPWSYWLMEMFQASLVCMMTVIHKRWLKPRTA